MLLGFEMRWCRQIRAVRLRRDHGTHEETRTVRGQRECGLDPESVSGSGLRIRITSEI